jgi:hypothetical protein
MCSSTDIFSPVSQLAILANQEQLSISNQILHRSSCPVMRSSHHHTTIHARKVQRILSTADGQCLTCFPNLRCMAEGKSLASVFEINETEFVEEPSELCNCIVAYCLLCVIFSSLLLSARCNGLRVRVALQSRSSLKILGCLRCRWISSDFVRLPVSLVSQQPSAVSIVW